VLLAFAARPAMIVPAPKADLQNADMAYRYRPEDGIRIWETRGNGDFKVEIIGSVKYVFGFAVNLTRRKKKSET